MHRSRLEGLFGLGGTQDKNLEPECTQQPAPQFTTAALDVVHTSIGHIPPHVLCESVPKE